MAEAMGRVPVISGCYTSGLTGKPCTYAEPYKLSIRPTHLSPSRPMWPRPWAECRSSRAMARFLAAVEVEEEDDEARDLVHSSMKVCRSGEGWQDGHSPQRA